jgi:hypothetical protein
MREAEAYITERERHIRQQRELVDALEREGPDATAARNLLAIFEDLKRQYLAERDRLVRAKARERPDGPAASSRPAEEDGAVTSLEPGGIR